MSIDLADALRIPYRPGGRTLDGMDCWGLVMELRKRAGLDTPELATGLDASLWQALRNGRKVFTPLDEPTLWCIVAIKAPRSPHMGVRAPGGLVVHTTARKGVHVTPARDLPIRGYYELATG